MKEIINQLKDGAKDYIKLYLFIIGMVVAMLFGAFIPSYCIGIVVFGIVGWEFYKHRRGGQMDLINITFCGVGAYIGWLLTLYIKLF